MGKSIGSANLAASLNVLAGAPLDSRLVVDELSDLTASGTFDYFYEGMPVYVKSETKIYILIGSDPTESANWKEQGSGGGGGGSTDYTDLSNKPQINGTTLTGNKTTSDLSLPDSLEDMDDVEITDVEDGQTLKWDETASKWVNASGGSGGGGTTTKAITAAIDVGGISEGTSYPVDTPLEDILADLLEPTLYPTLTAPSATLTYSANQYYAVGATVTAATATVALNRGSINPAYGTSGYRSGTATGYSVSTSGADTEYSDSSDASGSFSVPALTRATKGTIVLTGTVSYGAGEQPKDSKGADYDSPLAAGSVSATKTLTFIQPYYYGASNSSTVSSFTGLTENVTAKGNKTFNYTTNNQYMVFAYDSSYGNLKTILDGNGFDVTGGWTKSTVTVGGFSYFVYVANSPTTDTNAPFTFKY